MLSRPPFITVHLPPSLNSRMRSSSISLGILGAAHPGLPTLAAAIARQRRLQLTGIYDPCLALAEQSAAQFQVVTSIGFRRLLRRVEGLVLLESSWMGPAALELAVEAGRSTLILRSALEALSMEQLLVLRDAARARGVLLMPELRYRWTRATLRLRELTATRLGAIERLNVEFRGAAQGLALLDVIDFCQTVIQSECRVVESREEGAELLLRFRRLGRDDSPVTAQVRCRPAETGAPELMAEVTCRHGEARLAGDSHLSWTASRLNETESLTGERTGPEVMLDLFGRRLAGGVVPVPDLGDVLRASQVSAALSLSRARGAVVDLNPAE